MVEVVLKSILFKKVRRVGNGLDWDYRNYWFG